MRGRLTAGSGGGGRDVTWCSSDASCVHGLFKGATRLVRALLVASRVVTLPLPVLQRLLAGQPAFSELVLLAFLAWRALLIDAGAGLRLVGSRASLDAQRLREFAHRTRVPYDWLDLDTDLDARALLNALGVNASETPIVVWESRVLRHPTTAAFADALGLGGHLVREDDTFDLAVIGAGPAGLAAVYGASEGLSTVMMLEQVAPGGHVEPRRERPRLSRRGVGHGALGAGARAG